MSTDTDARLDRLERLAAFGVLERHGLSSPRAHDVRRLRAQALRDAEQILSEHDRALETRAA